MSIGCGFHKPQALEIIDDKQLFRIEEDGTSVPINAAAHAATAQKRPSFWGTFSTPTASAA